MEPKRRFKLLDDCRSVMLERLGEVVANALERMADELTTKAMDARQSGQQRAFLDAVVLVREQRDALERLFRREFAGVFERRLFARPGSDEQKAVPTPGELFSDELKLVSEEAISDKIDVDRLIQRARSRLDPDEVLGIRARLGALLERDWFEEANHPASPEAVYEALRAALNEIAPSADVRHALLTAFEPHLTRNLNAIYNTVNSRLVAQQVLPRIRPRVASIRPHDAATPGAAGGLAGPGAGGTGMSASTGGYMPGAGGAGSVGAVGAGSAGTGSVPVSQVTLAALQQALMRAAVGSPRGRTDAAKVLSDPSMFGVADLPIEPVSAPLLDSLTEMQIDLGGDPRYGAGPALTGFAGDDGGSVAAAEVDSQASARMVMELLPLLIEKVKESGTPLDQMTVELVSVVFDYIYADKALAEPVKHQLLRLQVIAVKAALLDRSFFARRQHPMRLLIDRISQLAADPDADLAAGSPMVIGLTGVIDKLVAEFSSDLGIFLKSIDRLDELAQQEATRRTEQLDNQLKAAAREEAYAIALEEARSEIAVRLDQGTPDFVRAFLLRWWTPVIARSNLDAPAATGEGRAASAGNDDPANNDSPARKALRIAEFLIWSVTPKHPEEIARLAALVPKLIRAMNDGARAVDVPEPERAEFMQELLQAHARAIGQAKSWQSGQPDPRAAAVRLRSDGSVRFSQDRRDRPQDDQQTVFVGAAALGHFEKGDRIEIIDDAGHSSVYKLAWISPARKLYILSRYPQETLTFNANDLAALVLCNKARVVEGAAAVDLAIGELTREDGFTAQTH